MKNYFQGISKSEQKITRKRIIKVMGFEARARAYKLTVEPQYYGWFAEKLSKYVIHKLLPWWFLLRVLGTMRFNICDEFLGIEVSIGDIQHWEKHVEFSLFAQGHLNNMLLLLTSAGIKLVGLDSLLFCSTEQCWVQSETKWCLSYESCSLS